MSGRQRPTRSAFPSRDDRLGLLGRLDAAARHDGYPAGPRLHARVSLNEGGRREVPVGQVPLDRVEVALAQREVIDQPVGGELASDALGVLDREAARRELVDAEPVPDHEAGPRGGANSSQDLERKPEPVLEAPAPLVGAAIAERRDELLDQVPLRTMHLDAIHAGLDAVHGAHDVRLDHFAHFAGR